MKIVSIGYLLLAIIFCIFSFGFMDPNLHLSTHPLFIYATRPLMFFVYKQSLFAALLYIAIIISLYILYGRALYLAHQKGNIRLGVGLVAAGVIFFLSYPALSYDIYNYILTAKVSFYYHENPYVVMPIEFIGEPMLAFTRAANKLALYGPVWIASTYIPHLVAANHIALAIYTFKLLSIGGYIGIIYLIYKKMHRLDQVVFFALNPLVIIEVFTSGHNDAFMLFLALSGMLLWQQKTISRYILGTILVFSSVLVKGATVVFLPVMWLLGKYSFEVQMKWVTALLFCVFLLSPLREEMYPWYAVWWLSALAFVPIKKPSFVHGAAIWLSIGLMTRYVPWIATREYGGDGPIIRFLVTLIPVAVYVLVWGIARLRKIK